MNPVAFHLRRRAGATLAVVCLALLFCAPAQAARSACRTVKHGPVAAPRTKPVTPAVAPAAVPPALTPGMVVSVEPGTGRLVTPSAEEMQLLSAAERTGLLRTSAGLTEVQGPGGAIGVDLQGRFMEYSLVRLDPMGRPHFFCVNDEIRLRALLAPSAPTPTPALEEK
jgi:hypothetical protein